MTARRHVSLTVGNLKGGTAKTTTAMYVAAGLARAGRVLLVDADPQGSALDWSEHTERLPATVIPWPTRDLARRVADVAGDYDHIVIDTGPGNPAILRQALLATDELLVPVAPSPVELRRLAPTFELAAEVDAGAGHPVLARVLLARVQARTRAAAAARTVLADLGLPVMTAEIPLRQRYALAWGSVPGIEPGSDYDQVLADLLTAAASAPAAGRA